MCFHLGLYASEPKKHSREHQMRVGEDERKLGDVFCVNLLSLFKSGSFLPKKIGALRSDYFTLKAVFTFSE